MIMKYYIEITLLQNSEISFFNLWSKTFQQIHLGLVEMQDVQGQVPIGVSFPEYVISDKCSLLGSKLRLFANEEATLIKFNVTKWLSRLSDYVHCTGVRDVPDKLLGYAIYQREQAKSNKERLARRCASRHSLDYESALARYSDMVYKKSTTPFISIKSLSSDNDFCLKIKKTLVNGHSGGVYSSYGLSSVSSVPEF
jgi:CRISPR-associated endonuclease Csy4